MPTIKSAVRAFCHQRGIPVTRDARKLRRYKNRHLGQRAFVIGMGPSLRVEDLDRLKGEVTFACNKCYLAFDETSWRPSYYCVEDTLVFENNLERIQTLEGFPQFYPMSARNLFPSDHDGIFFPLRYSSHDHGAEEFSFNPLERIFGGFTVTYILMQLAAYMGVRQIYLVGMDYTFILPKETVGVNEQFSGYVSEGEQNHFHPEYRKKGETWVEPNLENQFTSFETAKRVASSKGIEIINATRGGNLEVFPRQDLDEVLHGVTQ